MSLGFKMRFGDSWRKASDLGVWEPSFYERLLGSSSYLGDCKIPFFLQEDVRTPPRYPREVLSFMR